MSSPGQGTLAHHHHPLPALQQHQTHPKKIEYPCGMGKGSFSYFFLCIFGLRIVGPCIEMDRMVLEMGFDSIEVPIDLVLTILDNVPHLMV